MRRSRIRPVSRKRASRLREERKIRRQLEERAGEACEECGRGPGWLGLHPHERVFRSHGGMMSMENSAMSCDSCHKGSHGIRVARS